MSSPLEEDHPETPSSPDPFGDSASIFTTTSPPSQPRRTIPSFRSISDSQTTAQSSNPLAPLNAARRPGPPQVPFASMQSVGSGTGGLPKDVHARLQAFQASRRGAPSAAMSGGTPTLQTKVSPVIGPAMSPTGAPFSPAGGMPGSPGGRPAAPQNWISAPAMAGRVGPPRMSLMERRRIQGFPGALPPAPGAVPPGPLGGGNPVANGGTGAAPTDGVQGSLFDKYSEYVDAKTGSLKFAGKAVLHSKGVDFSSGSSFSISLEELDQLEELGKGNYGTVHKVVHRRPTVSRNGAGPMPNCPSSPISASSPRPIADSGEEPPAPRGTGVEMAMKEIRLELDENKFAQIIMELDVLHRCLSPFIIDFYGAFFQEGAVYICMEYMDGGSIDKLYKDGVPENVLRKLTYATVMGLKTLKDDHNIIHRDVKPTNILVNTRGEIKLCDFGVSGNLVASIAKTNIGCQSYMAPERIASGGVQATVGGSAPGTYSVQSDIWSLGLSLLECAMGCYPYPPETYNNIFSQLSAIVDGEPPDLPEKGFSAEARNFVRGCLNKIPNLRPTYSMLLRHPWLSEFSQPATISEEDEEMQSPVTPPTIKGDKEVAEWVVGAIAERKARIESGGKGTESEKPALHAAPLDVVVIAPTKDAPAAEPTTPGDVKPEDQELKSATSDLLKLAVEG
ncbi:unnamed protein product [Tuber aestivum]|uniref:mitogen-activated protein kinase kinase n=1 Tax=Tuber aestivum TaxID=59557 RepID=A0A292PR49_9PEZI|nr:unnamed protein product [Tuber aestivum]